MCDFFLSIFNDTIYFLRIHEKRGMEKYNKNNFVICTALLWCKQHYKQTVLCTNSNLLFLWSNIVR